MVSVVLAASFVCGVARADATREAGEAYDEGARAYDARDYATASQRFALADEKVPSGRALELAMASALLAGEASLGMDLVVRAERRSVDGSLAALAARLRKRFAGAVGSVTLVCAKGRGCKGTLEGRALTAGLPRHAVPGPHTVEITRDDGSTLAVSVSLSPGEDTIATEPSTGPAPAAPPERPRAEAPSARDGLSPVYFGVGAGLTAVGIGAAVGLTARTAGLHADFRAAPSEATSAAGDAAQTAARVMWGVSAVALVGTVVLFVLTDFGGPTAAKVSLGPGSLSLAGRF